MLTVEWNPDNIGRHCGPTGAGCESVWDGNRHIPAATLEEPEIQMRETQYVEKIKMIDLGSHQRSALSRAENGKQTTVARNALPVNKLKKDPGVPKLNLKQKQVNKIAERLRHEAHRRAQGDGMTLDLSPSIAGLAAKASASKNPLGEEEDRDADASLRNAAGSTTDPTLAAHAHQFKKVLETADVILQVLDARDPLGCRSKLVEEAVLRSGGDKKIILVLNKTDLVPKENVQAWLTYLRHSYPTIPFKSSTQQQRTNLSTSSSSLSSSRGVPHLLHLLKSIRPAHQSITVGVLGPPNVGKSSLINSIKREKVCTVGAKPGETRALKEVAVERGIKVIDSPGIVWGDHDGEAGVLRNVWSLEGLEDPPMVVESIVSRVPAETLQQMYGTPPFKDAMELLTMVALVRGKLGKGGVPDISSAALSIIHDWNVGKIPFHTTPPAIHPSMLPPAPLTTPSSVAVANSDSMVDEATERAAAYANTSIVSQWGKAFDLDGLWKAADEDVLREGGGGDEEMQEDDGDGFVPDEDQGDGMTVDDSNTPEEITDPVSQALRPPKRPLSPSTSVTSFSRPQHQVRERRPPKRPRERTQRLAPKGVDEDVNINAANPLGRKKLKEEAKKKKKEARRAAGGLNEDIGMGGSDDDE
ncbi:hypothetical protein M407DRAFT_232566 [Tulasnella calospora MUT 4182]|uniref:CP-type G domain-containing protein n=1 Tax=Tulasnella calospora MUT 4182 TaxID=1051891 RepID=A0A0C3QB24_9AGAM|nr:hypothetical protein M407DRAFT_232566 [Tulasnella calospora MUT 4182]